MERRGSTISGFTRRTASGAANLPGIWKFGCLVCGADKGRPQLGAGADAVGQHRSGGMFHSGSLPHQTLLTDARAAPISGAFRTHARHHAPSAPRRLNESKRTRVARPGSVASSPTIEVPNMALPQENATSRRRTHKHGNVRGVGLLLLLAPLWFAGPIWADTNLSLNTPVSVDVHAMSKLVAGDRRSHHTVETISQRWSAIHSGWKAASEATSRQAYIAALGRTRRLLKKQLSAVSKYRREQVRLRAIARNAFIHAKPVRSSRAPTISAMDKPFSGLARGLGQYAETNLPVTNSTMANGIVRLRVMTEKLAKDRLNTGVNSTTGLRTRGQFIALINTLNERVVFAIEIGRNIREQIGLINDRAMRGVSQDIYAMGDIGGSNGSVFGSAQLDTIEKAANRFTGDDTASTSDAQNPKNPFSQLGR